MKKSDPDSAESQLYGAFFEAEKLRKEIADRADLAEHNLMLCIQQRDAALAEAADLRRQLAEAQHTASTERARRIDKSNVAEHWQREHAKATEDAADLRRQLAECRQIAIARGEELGYAEADADWIDAEAGNR